MSEGKKLTTPVKPSGMDIVFYYSCPFCSRKVPLLAPTKPSAIRCDSCHKQFNVAPVDEKNLRFIKTIMDEGRAGIDPDFV